jgi:Grx4 family monothiol glutaredoxin
MSSESPFPSGSLTRWTSDHSFPSLLAASSAAHSQVFVIFFTAAFYPPCEQMNGVCELLAKENPLSRFIAVEAEEFPAVAAHFTNLQSVPTFYFLKGGKMVDQIEGPNAPELTNKLSALLKAPLLPAQPLAASQVSHSVPASAPASESVEQLHARLDRLITSSPVMVFIKGTPDAPRCGFTRKMLALLNDAGIQFGTFDILSDQAVREGLKVYKNWPTFPQLYINGELIGGLDIATELHQSGELLPQVPASAIKVKLEDRLKRLINEKPIMLFMKGTPAQPQCGFSNQAVQMLNAIGAEFGSFNIFDDNEVREGLKTFSNWPTYPQLYVKGELIGGLDIMKELHEAGELSDKLFEAMKTE